MVEEEKKEPLWLPKNSVRSILVLVSLFAAIAMIFNLNETPEWFITLLASAFGFYFGLRSKE